MALDRAWRSDLRLVGSPPGSSLPIGGPGITDMSKVPSRIAGLSHRPDGPEGRAGESHSLREDRLATFFSP